eukprot:5217187-Amphidinium_carterae.1
MNGFRTGALGLFSAEGHFDSHAACVTADRGFVLLADESFLFVDIWFVLQTLLLSACNARHYVTLLAACRPGCCAVSCKAQIGA